MTTRYDSEHGSGVAYRCGPMLLNASQLNAKLGASMSAGITTGKTMISPSNSLMCLK